MVIENIAAIVGDATQQRRLQKTARWTAIGFAALLLTAGGVSFGLSRLVASARKSLSVTQAAERKARHETEVQTVKARSAADEARRAANEATAAEQRQKKAETQRDEALEETKDANRQTAAAREQTKAAEEQKKNAQDLGHALSLANNATVILEKEHPKDLPKAALLAAKAMMETNRLHIPSLQTNQAALQVLDLMPVVHDPLKGRAVDGVLGMSPDGALVAIRDKKNIAVVSLKTNHSVVFTEVADPTRIRMLAFSGNSSRCGAVITDAKNTSELRIWNTATGFPAGRPIAVDGPESGFDLDFDGERVALRHSDNEHKYLVIRRVTSGEREGNELKTDSIEQMAFSRTEPLIVFSSGNELRMWHWKDEKDAIRIGSDEDTGSGFRFLFTRNGDLVASSFHIDRAMLALWSLTGGVKRKWRQERDHLFGIALAPDEQTVAAWDDHGINLYSIPKGTLVSCINSSGTTIAAVSNWFLAAASNLGVIKVFDLENQLERDRVVYEYQETPIAIALDGNRITVVTPIGVKQWGDIEGPVTRLNTNPRDVAFFPDEDALAVLPPAGETFVPIYTAAGKQDGFVKTTGTETAIAAASSRRILLGDRFGDVRVYPASGNSTPPPLRQRGDGPVVALAASRSSLYVAVATPKNVSVWSGWATAHPTRTPLKDARGVTALAFGETEDQLVTGSDDGLVQVWNWRTGSKGPPMHHGSRVNSVSANRKGTIASAGGRPEVNLWDARTGKKKPPLMHDQAVNSAAFDPSGDYVATTSADYFFRIWYVGGKGPPQTVMRVQFDEHINRAAFSPSGLRVAYGGWLTLSAWKTTDLLDALCHRVDCSASAPDVH